MEWEGRGRGKERARIMEKTTACGEEEMWELWVPGSSGRVKWECKVYERNKGRGEAGIRIIRGRG